MLVSPSLCVYNKNSVASFSSQLSSVKVAAGLTLGYLAIIPKNGRDPLNFNLPKLPTKYYFVLQYFGNE